MKTTALIAISLALAGSCLFSHAGSALPRSTPEAQQVSSADLLECVEALDNDIEGMHSLMVVRNGYVIAEGWWAPYDPEHNHILYSLSKSFASTAIGFAVAEGTLDLFDPVLDFFPDAAPDEPGNNLKAMRIRDLLTMSTGHQDEPSAAPDTVSAENFLAQSVPHKPGTHFKYNTAATFMLSAILQEKTGETLMEYLEPRLFEPLGIEIPVWDTNYQGIPLGGYGLRVRTEDIAKFGQLYLQKGKWNGKQLLPEEWVEMATSRQVSNGSNPNSDWDQGYGFQFWRSRHGAYRGDGAFGQYCVVMPEQNAVVAITSGVSNMQAVLNILWDKLLPAFQSEPLPSNGAAHAKLEAALKQLVVPHASGSAQSPQAKSYLNRKYVFPENEQNIEHLTLTSGSANGGLILKLRMNGNDLSIPCGHQTWTKSRAPLAMGRLAQFSNEPIAASYGWPDAGHCVVKVCAYETPFINTFDLQFEEDEVVLNAKANVAFGPTQRPEIVGKAQ